METEHSHDDRSDPDLSDRMTAIVGTMLSNRSQTAVETPPDAPTATLTSGQSSADATPHGFYKTPTLAPSRGRGIQMRYTVSVHPDGNVYPRLMKDSDTVTAALKNAPDILDVEGIDGLEIAWATTASGVTVYALVSVVPGETFAPDALKVYGMTPEQFNDLNARGVFVTR